MPRAKGSDAPHGAMVELVRDIRVGKADVYGAEDRIRLPPRPARRAPGTGSRTVRAATGPTGAPRTTGTRHAGTLRAELNGTYSGDGGWFVRDYATDFTIGTG